MAQIKRKKKLTTDVKRRVAGVVYIHDVTSLRNVGALFPIAVDLASEANAVMTWVFPGHYHLYESTSFIDSNIDCYWSNECFVRHSLTLFVPLYLMFQKRRSARRYCNFPNDLMKDNENMNMPLTSESQTVANKSRIMSTTSRFIIPKHTPTQSSNGMLLLQDVFLTYKSQLIHNRQLKLKFSVHSATEQREKEETHSAYY